LQPSIWRGCCESKGEKGCKSRDRYDSGGKCSALLVGPYRLSQISAPAKHEISDRYSKREKDHPADSKNGGEINKPIWSWSIGSYSYRHKKNTYQASNYAQ